jgi:hypothetical protein
MTHHNQTNELTIWFLAEYEAVLLGLRNYGGPKLHLKDTFQGNNKPD